MRRFLGRVVECFAGYVLWPVVVAVAAAAMVALAMALWHLRVGS